MIDGSDVKVSASNAVSAYNVVGNFVERLELVFGLRFLRYLVLTYFGLKGVVLSLLTSAMLPYFQAMNVSGSEYQLAFVVSRIPWSMKGWVGVLSDICPIGRYHKRGYLLASALIGTFGVLGLSLLRPVELGPWFVWPSAALFCATNVLLSTFDLLCEGKYSELMRERHAGSEVLTLVWTCMQLGGLVGALFVGALVDAHGARPIIVGCLPVVVLSVWRTMSGDLPEQPARSRASLWLKARSEPGLFVLAAAMAGGSLVVALSTAFLPRFRDIIALVVSGGLILLSFQTLTRTLARCNLYMFICSVAYLDLTGALSYFYTGTDGCIKDGPHFSYSYFLAVSNVVGSGGAILGAVLFQRMQHWQFRSAFVFTVCVQVVASMFDVVIINRWNIRSGISDAATYLFGDAACQSIASQMQIMPMALLTARLCPRGAEATVFAILAGFQNFGAAVASILGVQVVEALGIQASRDGPCNFENLSLSVILCHCIIPLLCLPLTWCLVPAARIDDAVAFDACSPPPSFRSPAPSPASSPPSSPKEPEFNLSEEYLLMQDDGGDMTRRFTDS